MRRRSPSTMVAMAIQLRAPCGQSANNQISAKTPLQPRCSLPHFEVLPQDIEIVLRARTGRLAPTSLLLAGFNDLARQPLGRRVCGHRKPHRRFVAENKKCEAAETQRSEPGTDQSMQPSPYRKPNTADRNGVSLPMTDLCRFVWRAPT